MYVAYVAMHIWGVATCYWEIPIYPYLLLTNGLSVTVN